MAQTGIKKFLSEIFVWWQGQTWGTRLAIWRTAEQVGTDDLGNTYFWDRKNDRRYVTYNGYADASKIPPGWHGWMHHRTDVLPANSKHVTREWEKPHVENLTGTAGAYRPEGSLLKSGQRPRVTGDYDAWSPE